MLVIFAVIFCCGLAAGAALMDLYVHNKIVRPAATLSTQQLEDELHMTAPQRQAITRELDEYAKYYQNIEEQRQSVAEQGKRNILNVLQPDQQKRFLQLFQFPTTPPCASDQH